MTEMNEDERGRDKLKRKVQEADRQQGLRKNGKKNTCCVVLTDVDVGFNV